jgi:hypothetical protein
MTWRSQARAVLREPLVHFLLAGALVFVLLSGRAPDAGERRIVVDEATVGGLVQRWTMTYRRPPSQDEIDGLIREYVKDQVYYREGKRLGLDQNDEVVIRRMRQKLASTASAEAEISDPSGADLQAWMDRDPGRYAPEPRLTFRQVLIGPAGSESRRKTKAALVGISRGVDAETLGITAPIPAAYDDLTASEVTELFGDSFVPQVRRLKPGMWSGPIESGVGLHLVRLDKLVLPPAPRLADIRQQVENDWRAAAIAKAEAEGYRKLLEGYDVVIQRPE